MKKWGKRFNHIHIKGSIKIDNERFDDPPAGMDLTDGGAFMSILYAYNYNKTLSIEPHLDRLGLKVAGSHVGIENVTSSINNLREKGFAKVF